MNETTILVWINIAIVGIIAIIIVKLYFRKDELEKDDSPLLSKDSLNKLSQSSENNLSKTTELEEMTFNDGVDSIKSYVRIPIEEEEGLTRSVISEEVTQVYNGTSYLVKYYKGCNYSPLLSDKSQDGDYIATLTKGKAGYFPIYG